MIFPTICIRLLSGMTGKGETISLIGAGLNGPLLALGLVRRGFRVEIFERRPDMRRVRMSAGRSINLALSTRGIHALTQAGLWNEMRKIVIPMKGRMMHSATSELTFQPYGKNDAEVIHSISRAELNIALINAAEREGVKFFLQQRCVGIDLRTGILKLRDEQTGESKTHESSIVIGCDGSASAIRAEMLKLNRFNFSQQYLDYGYKELTIPAGPEGKHVLETNALHIWPRGNYMLIALPNLDGTFACILSAVRGTRQLRATRNARIAGRVFPVAVSRCGSPYAGRRSQFLWQPDGSDGDHQVRSMAYERASSVTGRCGACDCSFLWAGN